jgi:phage recombination protein Bet
VTTTAVVAVQPPSLLRKMAERFGMEPNKLHSTLMRTIFPQDRDASPEQVQAFLVVANQYELNPFTKEIYAFPSTRGGIMPIVSIDGWVSIVQRRPQYNGVKQVEHFDDKGALISITTEMYRKDQDQPTVITEYLSECYRDTEPWRKWKIRMLRHKSYIQCARYAFGLSGIYDEDEAERIVEAEGPTITLGKTLPAEIKRRSEIDQETEESQVGPTASSHQEVSADPPTSSGESSAPGPTPGEPSTSTEQSPTMAVPPNQEHSLRRSRRPQEPEDGVRLNFGDRSSKHDDRG